MHSSWTVAFVSNYAYKKKKKKRKRKRKTQTLDLVESKRVLNGWINLNRWLLYFSREVEKLPAICSNVLGMAYERDINRQNW